MASTQGSSSPAWGPCRPRALGQRALARRADGRSCVGETQFIRPYRGRIKFSAQVQGFDPAGHLDADVLPFCDPVTQYLLTAADEAMAQAGLTRDRPLGPRTASIIGTGAGGMHTIEDGMYSAWLNRGVRRP